MRDARQPLHYINHARGSLHYYMVCRIYVHPRRCQILNTFHPRFHLFHFHVLGATLHVIRRDVSGVSRRDIAVQRYAVTSSSPRVVDEYLDFDPNHSPLSLTEAPSTVHAPKSLSFNSVVAVLHGAPQLYYTDTGISDRCTSAPFIGLKRSPAGTPHRQIKCERASPLNMVPRVERRQ